MPKPRKRVVKKPQLKESGEVWEKFRQQKGK
jgi:hypothetical protein